jgi:hypothetical protein
MVVDPLYYFNWVWHAPLFWHMLSGEMTIADVPQTDLQLLQTGMQLLQAGMQLLPIRAPNTLPNACMRHKAT